MSTTTNQRIRKFSGFAVFVLWVLAASLAHAQPQAPVVWGDWRWLGFHDDSTGLVQVEPMGDTLVFLGAREFGPNITPYAAYSYDDGISHSPWQWVGPADTSDCSTRLASSGGHAYLFYYAGMLDRVWMRRSSDGGASWEPRQNIRVGAGACGFASGSHVYQSYGGGQIGHGVLHFGRSDDYGATWPLDVAMDTILVDPSNDQSIARTQGHILVVARRPSGSPDRWIWVARSDNEGENWVPFDTLAGQSVHGVAALYSIAADTTSETAIVAMLMQVSFSGPYQMVLWRTTDGGQTWEPPIAGTDSATVRNPTFKLYNFCRGKLWGVAWQDVRVGDWSHPMYWRFSANHGRNWYPEQRAATGVMGAWYFNGQFVNNEVRLYWYAYHDSLPFSGPDFATVTGVLTPDTISPVIQPRDLPPDTVSVSSQPLFLALVDENDTLSRVELKVRDLDSVITVPMSWTGSDYTTRWTVPHLGRYFYRIEAEDWWENVGSYPDTGWAVIVTQGWVDDANPVIVHPSEFSLSVSPNPFNPTTTISFSLPKASRVKVEVFDVMGRSVQVLEDEIQQAGEHRVAFDGTGLASGIYFARVTSGSYHATQKMMLLK